MLTKKAQSESESNNFTKSDCFLNVIGGFDVIFLLHNSQQQTKLARIYVLTHKIL